MIHSYTIYKGVVILCFL